MERKKRNIIISSFDKHCYDTIRENVRRFMRDSAKRYDKAGYHLLDIAPQIHEGAAPFFKKCRIETLDIDPNSGATHIGDITKRNPTLADARYDVIVCTEVLEHTLDPFAAVAEMRRLLKRSRVLLATTPFNFRIHGPLPDCWRFTEHGLRALFKKFSSVQIVAVETPGRDLMPMHYAITAVK